MINIDEKYLILIWIIILVLFTFYCIIRMYYLNKKHSIINHTKLYNDNYKNNNNNNNNNTYLKENYNITDPPTPTQIPTQLQRPQQTPQQTRVQTLTSPPPPPLQFIDIISYINNIAANDKITDMPSSLGCNNVYDDNIAVKSLGYNSCQNAYADYLAKNLDVNNKFGQKRTLADICPVSTKSAKYSQCLQVLLNKFTINADILTNINTDMTNTLNTRIDYRNGVLNNIQNDMNPLIYNKDQNDFTNYMTVNGAVAKYPSDVISLVNNYYQDKYESGIGIVSEGFIAGTSTYIVDPALENLFFGNYKAINGQYLAFDDLRISIGYDNSTSQQAQQAQQGSQLNEIRDILLTITSDIIGLQIIFKIVKFDNYRAMPNAIKMIIGSKNIVNQTTGSQNAQKLLDILGLTSPTQIIMVYDEYVSTENIKHKTYKIVNDNLDTIMILKKI
jgi:hypothetical protein